VARRPSSKPAGPEKHRSGATPKPTREFVRQSFSASELLPVDFVALDRVPTGDKQSVNLSAQIAKCLVCVMRNPQLATQRTLRGCGYDFD